MTRDELIAGLADRGLDLETARQIVDKIPKADLDNLENEDAQRLFNTATELAVFATDQPVKSIDNPDDIAKVAASATQLAKVSKSSNKVKQDKLDSGSSKQSAEQTAEYVRQLQEAQAVPAAQRTPAQKSLINEWRDANPDKTEKDIVQLGAEKKAAGEEAELKSQLMSMLKVDEAGLEAIQKAAAARMGSDLPYSVMFNLARGDQEFLRIADETTARRSGYAVGSYNGYTDPFTGKQVMVRAGTDEALKTKLPGFADFGRAATRTVVDSSERFAGKMGFENIYGLFAYTLGIFDANQEPTITDWSETDDAQALWGSNAAKGALDQGSVRTAFARRKLEQTGKIPPRFLPDGTLNPVYANRSGGIPTSAGAVSFSSIYQDMWNSPEKYLDDDFWAKNDAEYKQALWEAKNAVDSDKAFMSDLKRERMYEEKKPQLDAYLAEFGDENSIAAIVAVHNPELGRKMARGLELTDEDLYNASVVFGGLDPSDVGIVRDGLGRYQMRSDAARQAKGPTINIVQPDREKITQGMQELYRSMFHADPNGDELGALVEQIAGQYISSQYSRTDFDPQAAATAALRGTDIYSQLYGNRPSGLSDEDYSAQFERTGQAMLGGMAAPGAAIQAGMRNNDANLTASVIAADKNSWSNSTFLEQFYRSMSIANEMT